MNSSDVLTRSLSALTLLATLAVAVSAACAPLTPSTAVTDAPEPPAQKSSGPPAAPQLKLTWRVQVSEQPAWAYYPQEFASPVFVGRLDDVIVGTSNGRVSRLRAGSGEVVWSVPFSSPSAKDQVAPIHASPLVHEQRLFVGSTTGSVQALAISDGESLWSYQAEDAIETALVYSSGRLIFMDASEVLYALDAETGKLLWRYQRRAPDYFTIKGSGIPVVDGGAVYCGFADGTLAAVDLDTGELIWGSDLTNAEVELTDVDAPVIISGQVLYAASYSGGVFAVSREDGVMQWQLPVTGVTRMIKRGPLLIAASAQGKVIAVDVRARQIKWSFRFKQDTPVDLSTYGPYLFVSTARGPLTVLDPKTGNLLARWNPSQGMNSPVTFEQRRGFALTNGGYLYAFEVGF